MNAALIQTVLEIIKEEAEVALKQQLEAIQELEELLAKRRGGHPIHSFRKGSVFYEADDFSSNHKPIQVKGDPRPCYTQWASHVHIDTSRGDWCIHRDTTVYL